MSETTTPVAAVPPPGAPTTSAPETATTAAPNAKASWARRHTRTIAGITGGIALVALLAFMAGAISRGKVEPGTASDASGALPANAETALVESAAVADPREFVGTIRPRSVAQVSAKLLARVLEVNVRMGESVEAGFVLARLDDRDVKARVEQAKLGLAAAEASLIQAESELRRYEQLAEKKATTLSELEAATARAHALRADVARLKEAQHEAEVFLGETTVRAPVKGRVLERHVEPGDMAAPGAPLFAIEASSGLRIEAWVPEACACTVQVGDKVHARIDATGRDLEVVLDEIAPSSEPGSHSFLVKAALPGDVQARPGEFARLIRPCHERSAFVIPARAVRALGQLELVTVVADGRAHPRHIRTGKRFGDKIEVLAGLEPGERVLVGRGP
jgi:RND family efflux transporter MFP subunit